ncbi:MAG: ATP-dependent protease ATPase subunit HslU [Planctomycetota bacterium]
MKSFTPEEIVRFLDRHIVGQDRAKRSVAVALRNRWRRRQLPEELGAEVYPKNILLIGPTGVGKTEIARRLAELANAPFLKVEASKYSEVGYHGRDVESMVRDLTEVSIRLVRAEKTREVRLKAEVQVRERLLEAVFAAHDVSEEDDDPGSGGASEIQYVEEGGLWRPLVVEHDEDAGAEAVRLGDEELDARIESRRTRRNALAADLENGKLEELEVVVELLDKSTPTLSVQGPQGTETMGIDARALQEIWGRSPGMRMKRRKLSVAQARKQLIEDEADALIDEDELVHEALSRVENDGIIFIDEIDKIVGAGGEGPDVSREGVQRDLLTVVEGCTVFTKYGYVSSDHILFLAAGAFHIHKPSELIPELQGRFPVRVALSDLSEEDFVRILAEPDNSLTRQYSALLATENVTLSYEQSGLEQLAATARKANQTTQNIGARRLLTVMERLLETVSFEAPKMAGQRVVIDRDFVIERLGDAADDPDLIKYMI